MTFRISHGLAVLVGAGILVAACGPVDVYHRAGAPAPLQEADLVQCETVGVNEVPTNTQVRTTPIVVTPTRTTCVEKNGKQECTTTGGDVTGGETESFDANEGLRERVVNQCMISKGYRKYTLDECTSRQLKGKTLSLNALSPVTQNTCVTKASGGGWIFVNP